MNSSGSARGSSSWSATSGRSQPVIQTPAVTAMMVTSGAGTMVVPRGRKTRIARGPGRPAGRRASGRRPGAGSRQEDEDGKGVHEADHHHARDEPHQFRHPEGGWDDLENAGEDGGGDGDGHDEARQEPNLRVDARDDRERDRLGDERERHHEPPSTSVLRRRGLRRAARVDVSRSPASGTASGASGIQGGAGVGSPMGLLAGVGRRAERGLWAATAGAKGRGHRGRPTWPVSRPGCHGSPANQCWWPMKCRMWWTPPSISS